MKQKKSVLKRISNIILTIILFLLALVVAVTLITRITGSTPSLFGYSIYRVSTGSMQPELMVGDVILSHQVDDVNSLKVGDVITYRGISGDYTDKLITHEIVKAPYEQDGVTYVVTKGIANQVEDLPVQESQIVGKLVCKIPFLDQIYAFFLTPWGLLAAILLIIIAFGGEFWNIYKLSHEKDELPEVGDIDEETLQKAIKQYKDEKSLNKPESPQLLLEEDNQESDTENAQGNDSDIPSDNSDKLSRNSDEAEQSADSDSDNSVNE